MEWYYSISFWAVVAFLFWVAGVLCAFRALMHTKSERGAVAWCIALLSMPFVAVPFYLVFGRRKFSGYCAAIDTAIAEHEELIRVAQEEFHPFTIPEAEMGSSLCKSLSAINRWQFSRDNHFELLIDGSDTFDAIVAAISQATEYILFQFYIIRDDGLGRRIKNALVAKAKQGVRVYFLYDEVGSYSLPKSYLADLEVAGVHIDAFGTTRGRANRFQINFRNHRKIVVCDGEIGFVGGHNVGDEYLGQSPTFGHWRDTHLQIEGPAVLECQAAFLMDWYWATRILPKVRTKPIPVPGGHPAMIMPSGPTRDFEILQVAFQSLISNAKETLWIASPYLVPDEATLVALRGAAARGVDVRIMIPAVKDHLIVYLAGFSFFEEMEESNIQVLRYGPGFLHQKAILVDDQIAGVGTVNLDQRSFLLNFEITAFTTDPAFVRSVKEMFEHDFKSCTTATAADYYSQNLPFRVGVRIARLFSPLL